MELGARARLDDLLRTYPLLEAHGMSGPAEVMWSIHDDIRAMVKKAQSELASGEA